jgi:hypothetical protein
MAWFLFGFLACLSDFLPFRDILSLETADRTQIFAIETIASTHSGL